MVNIYNTRMETWPCSLAVWFHNKAGARNWFKGFSRRAKKQLHPWSVMLSVWTRRTTPHGYSVRARTRQSFLENEITENIVLWSIMVPQSVMLNILGWMYWSVSCWTHLLCSWCFRAWPLAHTPMRCFCASSLPPNSKSASLSWACWGIQEIRFSFWPSMQCFSPHETPTTVLLATS